MLATSLFNVMPNTIGCVITCKTFCVFTGEKNECDCYRRIEFVLYVVDVARRVASFKKLLTNI